MASTSYVDFTAAARGIADRTDATGAAVGDISAEEDRLAQAWFAEGAFTDNAFKVNADAGMTVKVGSSAKVDLYGVAGDVTGQGIYLVRLDGTPLAVTLSPADPSQARTDEVYLVVADAAYDGGALSLPRIAVRVGDPGGGAPGPDAGWKASAKLATIAVAAGATAVAAPDITDNRVRTSLTAPRINDGVFTEQGFTARPVIYTAAPGTFPASASAGMVVYDGSRLYVRRGSTWHEVMVDDVSDYVDLGSAQTLSNKTLGGSSVLNGGAVVGTTEVQTLSNKTLSSPVISNFTNAGHAHTGATSGGQITDAALSAAVTVPKGGTGRATLTSARFLVGAGTAAVDLAKVVPAGAVVGTTDTQALTNKDLSSGTNTFPASLATDSELNTAVHAGATRTARPYARIRKGGTTSQGLTPNTDTTVTFNELDEETDATFGDQANNQLVTPVAGLYLIEYYLYWDADVADAVLKIDLIVNGAVTRMLRMKSTGNHDNPMQITCPVRCPAGATIKGLMSASSDFVYAAPGTSLSALWMSP